MGSLLEIEPELGKKWSWGGKGRGQKGREEHLGATVDQEVSVDFPKGPWSWLGVYLCPGQWEGKEVGDRGLGEGP